MNRTKSKIIKEFISAYNSFDITAMLKFLHSDVEFKNISGGEVTAATSGVKEFEALALQSSSLFKEREQKIISLKETRDIVNVVLDYHAVMNSGVIINLKGKSEYIFKGRLISSIIDES